MPRPALTQASVDAFRARACEHAIALFAERDDVSLRQLAAAIGCSHAKTYRYFESKEELFMAVRAECYRRFARSLRARLERVDDPIERIHELARAYAERAHTHRAEFRLMFQLGQPRAERYPAFHRAGVDAWAIVEHTMQRAVDAGALEGDATDLAHMMWASVHGVVSLGLAQRLTVGRTSDQVLTCLVDALCRAHGGASRLTDSEGSSP